jgi:hypothetical protein
MSCPWRARSIGQQRSTTASMGLSALLGWSSSLLVAAVGRLAHSRDQRTFQTHYASRHSPDRVTIGRHWSILAVPLSEERMLEGRRGRTWWIGVVWSLLALLCLWLTVATVLDRGGAWWVPLTFGGCTVVAAGSAVVWLRESATRG